MAPDTAQSINKFCFAAGAAQPMNGFTVFPLLGQSCLLNRKTSQLGQCCNALVSADGAKGLVLTGKLMAHCVQQAQPLTAGLAVAD